MHSEALPRTAAPEPVGAVVRALFGERLSGRLDSGRRALSAWLMSNGDLERRHTVKVWLRKAPREGMAPVMVVEVDSHALVTDFGAKRDVYLGRLAHYGQQVSRLEFRYALGGPRVREEGLAKGVGGSQPLPRPSDAELRRAEELVADLPDSLRDPARAAVAATLCRARQPLGPDRT